MTELDSALYDYFNGDNYYEITTIARNLNDLSEIFKDDRLNLKSIRADELQYDARMIANDLDKIARELQELAADMQIQADELSSIEV